VARVIALTVPSFPLPGLRSSTTSAILNISRRHRAISAGSLRNAAVPGLSVFTRGSYCGATSPRM